MDKQKDKRPEKTEGDVAPIQASEGYIVVDEKKCQGCVTCMLACSLVHDGVESYSKSRIQVVQDPFGKFPNDLKVEQCRQCIDAPCVEACPEDALEPNSVRREIPQSINGMRFSESADENRRSQTSEYGSARRRSGAAWPREKTDGTGVTDYDDDDLPNISPHPTGIFNQLKSPAAIPPRPLGEGWGEGVYKGNYLIVTPSSCPSP